MNRIALAAAMIFAAAGSALAGDTASSRFFDGLRGLCGKSFEGRVVTTDPADKAFEDKRLVMRVAACSDSEVRIPFAVGEDRSRTWVITRLDRGLRLKHDHRHEDGTEDVLSQYGGDTVTGGTATRQEFPADAFSKTLFKEKGNPASVTNVWAVEVTQTMFAYELRRPNRHFRVEFDLTKPLPAGS
ncbi:MAG TPA: hypothetical protein VEA44_14925 [Caulobacter sp.]|nr:hypothetical protein [Caulobacter sp.]